MVIGAMFGVALRFVLLFCFRSSVAVSSGRVHDDMSTLALFVLDPGAVLGASPSMHGVVTPVMMEKTCPFGWRYWELPSILVCPSCVVLVFCDAAMTAATLCRVLRGLPLMEASPWVRFQDDFAAMLAAAGAAPRRALETDRFLYCVRVLWPMRHPFKVDCRIWYGNALYLLRVSLDWYLSLQVSLS